MEFVQITENVLTKEQCEECMLLFEDNSDMHVQGIVSSTSNKDGFLQDDKRKKSTEIHLSFNEDNVFNELILPGLKTEITRYKDSYGSFYHNHKWTLGTFYNLQRYLPDEGYYKWHSEMQFQGTPPHPLMVSRVLAWMIYLNDVDDGGTEFMNQKETIQAKQGRCVVWPAYWTHTHRGQVSHTKTKYIATGWCNYVIDLYDWGR